ncbi:hypothetical protein Tco_0727972 [Tanacetum coccineum]|uniref:Uncharacterized protein n=1 Tax=Tanacetum coccineum TaxID=301880 RepID=A0ABQ4YM67_9ASTR
MPNLMMQAQVLKNGPFCFWSLLSCEEKAFIQRGITWDQRLRFRPRTCRLEGWNEENVVIQFVCSLLSLHQLVSRAEVPVKIPQRRNRLLTKAYEQEFEQRIMVRMEERLDQFVDQLDDRINDMMNLLDLVLCEVMVIKTPEPCISLVNVLGNSIR